MAPSVTCCPLCSWFFPRVGFYTGFVYVIVFEMTDVDDAESEGMPRNATTSAVLDGQVHL